MSLKNHGLEIWLESTLLAYFGSHNLVKIVHSLIYLTMLVANSFEQYICLQLNNQQDTKGQGSWTHQLSSSSGTNDASTHCRIGLSCLATNLESFYRHLWRFVTAQIDLWANIRMRGRTDSDLSWKRILTRMHRNTFTKHNHSPFLAQESLIHSINQRKRSKKNDLLRTIRVWWIKHLHLEWLLWLRKWQPWFNHFLSAQCSSYLGSSHIMIGSTFLQFPVIPLVLLFWWLPAWARNERSMLWWVSQWGTITIAIICLAIQIDSRTHIRGRAPKYTHGHLFTYVQRTP